MAANAIDWPGALLPSRPAVFMPDNPSRTGGPSMLGSEQIVASPGGRWRAKVALPVYTEVTALAYRAFISQLEGRAGTVLVPKWENFGPVDANGRRFSYIDVAGPGGMFDLSGYGQSDLVLATIHDPATMGTTRLTVDILDGDGPRPGQYIGLADRLYICQHVWQGQAGDPMTLQVWPRLRASAVAGQTVILDRPVCLMRLADDASGELALDHDNHGEGSLEFVEAI